MPHPEKRDLDLTAQQLGTWLTAKLPGAKEVRLVGLRGPSETGFSSDTLMFDAKWTGNDGEHSEHLVVRFKPTGFLVFPSYDVGLQFRVMKILGENTDVPVPRMRWYEPDEGPLGAEFYVMEQVDGRVPNDMPPYHTEGWVAELATEDRPRFWWNGFEAMTRVSRLDWKSLGFDFLDEPELGPTQIEQHLQYYENFFTWGVVHPTRYPLIQKVQRWLRENRPPEESIALCWGDARVSNQIFDDDLRCMAVIDWEMVRLGDPVQDLAWWILLDRCLCEGIDVPRLPGLPDRAATIARWEEIMGREARHVRYYEILGTYKFSVIMARITRQMKYYEILPEDNDMDVNNLASATLARLFEETTG